jgi:hypothetical protein
VYKHTSKITTAKDMLTVKSKSSIGAGKGITIIQTITTKPIARTISLFFSMLDNLENSILSHRYYSNIIQVLKAIFNIY